MKKIFIDDKINDIVILSGENHNHLAYSLRARVGDELIICKDNIDYYCKITEITKTSTKLSVTSSQECRAEPSVDITLFFALLKGDKNELVAQKATELGVKCLVPFVSANCESRPQNFKFDRLSKIITEAAQQCGRGRLPLLSAPIDLNEMAERLDEYDIVVFPYEKEENVALKSVIEHSDAKSIAIIVGSEGGFTKAEADFLVQSGAKSVTLGNRILRAETASIAVVSAIMYEVDQWRIN